MRISHWLFLACSVSAIEGVKTAFGLASWAGDPCWAFPYDWLDCNYTNWTVPLRVTAVYVTYVHLSLCSLFSPCFASSLEHSYSHSVLGNYDSGHSKLKAVEAVSEAVRALVSSPNIYAKQWFSQMLTGIFPITI
jgi:hypothetical protein